MTRSTGTSLRMDLSCEAVAIAALGQPHHRSGAEVFFSCLNHQDRHPSLAINIAKNCWMCGPCAASGTAWQLVGLLAHIDPSDKRSIVQWLSEHGLSDPHRSGNGNGSRHAKSEPKVEAVPVRVAEYYYGPNLRKIRIEPGMDGKSKSFIWEHLDGACWRTGAGDLKRPLYSNDLFRDSDQLELAIGCEGELKADVAEQFGFAAFSIKDLSIDHCAVFAGLDIVLWPDRDTSGLKQANAAAKLLVDSGQPRLVRVITPPDVLPIGGDIIDAVRTLGWRREQIGELIASAKVYVPEVVEVSSADSRVSIPSTDGWPEPIPLGELYGPIGDFVRMLAPETEADSTAIYVQTLVVVGNIIGRSSFCEVRDTRHHPNLFAGIVGPTSGARKGLGGDSVIALGRAVDFLWADGCVVSGLSSGEFIIDRLKDVVLDDAKSFSVAEKRLMIFEDELAFLLNSAKRESSTTSAVLRSSWDGKRKLQVDAKNAGAVATDAHVSLIGHVTREELLALLSDSMLKGGLVNRFLWICSKRRTLLPNGGRRLDYGPIAKRLDVAFSRPLGLIERDAEANLVWDTVYREIETTPRPGMFGKATVRGSAQTLRLSLLFALLDGERVIRAPHVKAAMAVWRFSEASARFIFGEFTGLAETQLILASLRTGPKTQTEISSLFHRNKSADQILALLDVLKRDGKVCCRSEATRGAPRIVWALTGT